ncbi:lysylphosphatidylglycerol synthase transmembrane domain-containing protein [Streptomyces sp. H27-C3]|uniref:lysylphosphatidylglycerol synthase transmembrane domain-containing protein n=1 Tax=Streptomyces sp. H27-C3 TaxID=3046305 RepID=UPI0024B9477D|nr:lysylphosphatidylglycerol synthase transmembrane domain-containing protein [Streptomyces sp. H27-C3]MDJ0466913.1 lysylphosphatidylglycerol synthase transmembrane domain-containing protein [Streptomyces sp. H27-C3]
MRPPPAASTPGAEPHPDVPGKAPEGALGEAADKASGTSDEVAGQAAAEAPELCEGGEHIDRVSGDEPLLSARVHRPADLLRLLIGVFGIACVLAMAAFAHGTTAGLEEDISKGTGQTPDVFIKLAGLISSIAVLILPVAFAIERLVKRDGLRIADGVLAAVLAHGVSLATDLWVSDAAPETIRNALTQPTGGGDLTDPVHGYLAPVIAYMTAVGMARRPRWRVALWAVLLLNSFTVLVGRQTTPFSILLTVLIGWTVAYGTLYAVGSPNVRPTGQTLLAGLRHVGFRPVTAMRAEDVPDSADQRDRGRRYFVTLEDGPPLDITVVDREQQAQGFFYRVWRRMTLRGITQRRSIQSLRQALEQEALLAYAAIAAGANAPKLIATSELGPDAVMLVYEHLGGHSLDSLSDEEITDELLQGAWRQVRALQSRRIAHRRLVGDAILVDRSGTVILTDLRGGEIAAGDVVLRMDIAQLLTTLALRTGAERAVAAAVAVLGPDAVAGSLPLLQPIALSRSTRATLRKLARERSQREREAVLEASQAAREAKASEAAAAEATPGGRKAVRAGKKAEKEAIDEALEEAREEDLLSQIRHQVLLIRPQAPVEPARLERIKPRTLLSFVAGAFAAYFLISALTDNGISQLGQAQWGWVAAAVALSALSYPAASMSLLGFVPEKVPWRRTIMAQVAGSFVKLVAPAAVGGVALNTRFLQRAGVRPGLAVASVGASQLFGLASHIVLLMTFGYLTGTERTPTMSPSRTVIAGLLTAAVLVLVVTAVPTLRKFVATRVRSLFAGVVPRMLDVLQRPQKLITGIGGMLLLTLTFVMCLDASIRAFGGGDRLSYAAIAVVFLTANAIGSAAPTPGGVGAVELALTTALTFAGLPYEIAAPAVLLYRLLTFWLPVLPGWFAFNYLTRKGAL